MNHGLTIRVVDPDEDYLGIEILAVTARFAGATRIYAELDALGTLASHIAGFPTAPDDERSFELGSGASPTAGGHARLRFHCIDATGHAALEVAVQDDPRWHGPASARFTFRIHAADLDRFSDALCAVEANRTGQAVLLEAC